MSLYTFLRECFDKEPSSAFLFTMSKIVVFVDISAQYEFGSCEEIQKEKQREMMETRSQNFIASGESLAVEFVVLKYFA